MEYLKKKNLQQNEIFKVEKGSFFPNRPISRADKTHVSLERNAFVLEAGAPDTLFP
jgi:hypothetical protein